MTLNITDVVSALMALMVCGKDILNNQIHGNMWYDLERKVEEG